MTRLTRLEQKWNPSFQCLDPRGSICILALDPMNANIAQLFIESNTLFHFHCYLNPNRLADRKTAIAQATAGRQGRAWCYFRKDENSLAQAESLSKRGIRREVGKADWGDYKEP